MSIQTKKLLLGIGLLVLFLASCQTKAPAIPTVLAEVSFDARHPAKVAVNPQTGYVYITNEANHIAVFQGLEPVATLQIEERRPSAMAVDEARGWVYVVNEYGNSVTVIRDTKIAATLDVSGDEPRDIAVEPTSGWAYIVTGHQRPVEGEERIIQGTVTVVSGTEVIGSISLGPVLTKKIVADPVNGLVYVGGVKGHIIVIKGLQEIARFDIGSTPTAMDVNPNTGDVFVLNRDIDRNLTWFNAGKLIATAEIEGPGGEVINMRVHPVTSDVYVLDLLLQQVVVVRNIDNKLAVIGRTPVGRSPDKMVIDPFTSNVYVANFGDDTVSVIHGTETIATIDVGWHPYGIGVNPANGWVYVSNTNGNTVSILGFEE